MGTPMEQDDGRVRIREPDLPREAHIDLGRFSVAVAGMLLCGIGLLWWSIAQFDVMYPTYPILTAVLCGAVACVGIAGVSLALFGAVRGYFLQSPAFRIRDGYVSSFYFSALPLDDIAAIHLVERKAVGVQFGELHFSTVAAGKTRVVPVWVLERSARLQILRSAADAD